MIYPKPEGFKIKIMEEYQTGMNKYGEEVPNLT